MNYAPYFLTVHDLVVYARSLEILCQGRGSAANSAVCYVLGITAVDPVRSGLLFERFSFLIQFFNAQSGQVRGAHLVEPSSALPNVVQQRIPLTAQIPKCLDLIYQLGETDLVAIPYYAWAHRGQGEMAVWLAREPDAARPLASPSIASSSKATASGGKGLLAVNDQIEPKSSIDHDNMFFHWWPRKGTLEWVRYDFEKAGEVSQAEVYWFDDTGIGECRLPASWRILYRDGEEWRQVYTTGTYGVEKDRYNRVVFETVKTDALRLEVQLPEEFSTGIHEWRVK